MRYACLQVFRTYNASITLDRLLNEMEEGAGVGHDGAPYVSKTFDEKKADYDRANKEVGRLGGPQRRSDLRAVGQPSHAVLQVP